MDKVGTLGMKMVSRREPESLTTSWGHYSILGLPNLKFFDEGRVPKSPVGVVKVSFWAPFTKFLIQ